MTGSSCTLAEALEWRQVEIMFADYLAEHLSIYPVSGRSPADTNHGELPAGWPFASRIPHFVLAVKHQSEMAYRLLFERSRLVLYFAHPITDVRLDPDKIREVNVTQEELSGKFTVYVPDTIDEFTLDDPRKRDPEDLRRAREAGLVLKEDDDALMLQRWPIFDKLRNHVSVIPSHLMIGTVSRLERVIKAHTERRDLRILRQGLDAMVAYRPFWGGKPSGGVDREMIEAAHQNLPVFALHKNENDGVPETMFRGIKTARTAASLDGIMKQLEFMQDQKRKKWRVEGIPETWE